MQSVHCVCDLFSVFVICFLCVCDLFSMSSVFANLLGSMFADVDIEGMEFTPGEGEGEGDSVDSVSDVEDHYSLQSSSSDGSYVHSHRLQPHIC